MQLQGEALSQKPYEGLPKKPSSRMKAVQGAGVLGVGLEIVQKEGPLGLFSGVSASALRHAVYSTTRLGLYEVLKQHMTDEDGNLPVSKKILAAMIAGAIGAAIGNPADVAMVRMQADGHLPPHMRRNYSSVADAIIQILNTEGLSSLWRGSMPTIQRAMVVTAAQLASYDQIKESLIASKVMDDGVTTHFAASFLAGVVASIVSNPIDVVKTRIQNMQTIPGLPPPYLGSLDCAWKTVQSEGFFALYKGFVPTVTRQGPFTITMMMTLEQVRYILREF
ncbi:hypothetical protein KP509_10G037900 [Ceratopteris richardii]|nr:hypothetical protein KP509_10G037900 [Ceratopteris richardii]